MSTQRIRKFGDPVLRVKASDVTDIDGKLAAVTLEMFDAMDLAEGIGLAATQVGIQKRFFVYDLDDGEGRKTLINPKIVESRDTWEYEEGCLSIPGLRFTIVRPKEVHILGLDIDGNEVSIEADELLARLFQHEIDHLDGVVMFDRLDEDERKRGLAAWRNMVLTQDVDRRTFIDDDASGLDGLPRLG